MWALAKTLAAILFGLALGVFVGLFTGITGCSSLVPELDDSATGAFVPRSGVVGWVEGLPAQTSPRQLFGCALGDECQVAGLAFTVRDYGDSMAIFTFNPSRFCGRSSVPIEHTSQRPSVTIALHWDQDRGAYVARDTISASAPAAADCWAGSSMIFRIHVNVVREAVPQRTL